VRGRNMKVNEAKPRPPRSSGGRPERSDRFQRPQQRRERGDYRDRDRY